MSPHSATVFPVGRVGQSGADGRGEFDQQRIGRLFPKRVGDYRQAGDEDQQIRSVLGRLLFSADDIVKDVKVLSGGEKNRMYFGRLMLGRHNVLLMDEPTNHLDMESIESLQLALEKFQGTLIFVSHDREFVSGLADRVIEIMPSGEIVDYMGGYEDYLTSRGIEG